MARPVPPYYRGLVKALHWASIAALLAVLVSGVTPVTRYVMVGPMILWLLGLRAYGVLGKPGPALSGTLATLFVPSHVLLYLLLTATAIAALLAPDGALTGNARIIALATVGAGLLHGVFHLWRHTALGDGALRNILPRAMHGIL